MAPSNAIETPCPAVRIVPKKPEARLSRDRSTAPITDEVFGELKAAMPIPTVPSAMMTRQTGVGEGRRPS